MGRHIYSRMPFARKFSYDLGDFFFWKGQKGVFVKSIVGGQLRPRKRFRIFFNGRNASLGRKKRLTIALFQFILNQHETKTSNPRSFSVVLRDE